MCAVFGVDEFVEEKSTDRLTTTTQQSERIRFDSIDTEII